jgi:hypothetical protein
LKTFKLVSLAIVQTLDNSKVIEEISLLDGLIIHKLDGENSWLIEAYVDKKYNDLFETLHKKNEEIHIQATITKKSNDPASLFAKIRSVNIMEDHTSILLDGVIFDKLDLAEMVLSELVDQGLQGAELLAEFKLKLREKRGSAAAIKSTT